MGASWNGVKSGTFGDIACFSTQTYKHINSGEGGFLTTRDAEIMAKAIIYSGSYMLFERHLAAPPKEAFAKIRFETPNYSGRMDNLRAAILRPQLHDLKRQCERWNARYAVLEKAFQESAAITIPQRHTKEQFVASSIQFSVPTFYRQQIQSLVENCAARGVMLKWFGGAEPTGYTSRYDSWKYLENMPQLPRTEQILETLMNMRIPLTFELEDCELIADIIVEVAEQILNR
jgi:dTDP-4-amino-4,6-dideoxygalactose transaminase